MTNMMNSSFLFYFLVLLQVSFCSHLSPVSAAAPSKVDEVCNKLVHINKAVTPNVCRSVFQHDPQSLTAADYHALGLIAVNITTRALNEALVGMKHTIHRIETSLSDEQNISAQGCIRDYVGAIPSLRVTAESLRIKNYLLAQHALSVAEYADSSFCHGDPVDEEGTTTTPYFGKFRSVFTTAVGVLAAMVQLLINTYGAY